MSERPAENYGLPGYPTEVEYLRADRKWLEASLIVEKLHRAQNVRHVDECAARISQLEAEVKALTEIADHRLERTTQLEAALREIASYQGPDSSLDINAKHMRDAAREAIGYEAETGDVTVKAQSVCDVRYSPYANDLSNCQNCGWPIGLHHEEDLEQTFVKAALCPHGFALAENICGPCSEGRPTTKSSAPQFLTTDPKTGICDLCHKPLSGHVRGSWFCTPVPDPMCKTDGCTHFVESSEDYCTDCLDSQANRGVKP